MQVNYSKIKENNIHSSNNRKIVVVNQSVNYLTIDIANAFKKKANEVCIISGNAHHFKDTLSSTVEVESINILKESPSGKKAFSYINACFRIWFLLLTKYRKHEVFFLSVPPMGYLINLIVPNRFSILVWDVYPDIFKITGMKESHPLYKFWSCLNKKSFKKAYRLYTIGERMADLLEVYVDRSKLLITPIWSKFQENSNKGKENNPFIQEHNIDNKFIVQYSGNIGLTHNVEVMIEMAELLKHREDILFQIIGKGARKEILEKMVEDKCLSNCQFLPFQDNEMFPYSLSSADLGAVILDDITSKGSVPSKSYNLMSYGIPSLYIASEDSELSLYAKTYRHAKCFNSKEIENAVTFIEYLADNKELQNKMKENALKASLNYKRTNADKIVGLYFDDNTTI